MKKLFFFTSLLSLTLSFCTLAQTNQSLLPGPVKLGGSQLEALSVEIVGVTVVPHHISYEIPPFDGLTQGAYIRFFVKNTDQKMNINPSLLFNGKSAEELIADGTVSYGDFPAMRSSVYISSVIPPGAVDCYLLNVMDSSFYNDGIMVSIIDTVAGKSKEEKITIERPDIYVNRIAFSSSTGSVYPDQFHFWMKNEKDEEVSINRIKMYPAGPSWKDHWWRDSILLDDMNWYGAVRSIPPHDVNGAMVKTGRLPFGESIIEFQITMNGMVNNLYYTVKPMVIDFDIGMGWGDSYFESELFLKTIKSFHINTVNGKAGNLYRNDEWADKYPMKRFHDLSKYYNSTDSIELERIHGDERLGEPQVDNKPAQPIYELYCRFRHSGFPTTVSLTHEPGFNKFAGVVDLNHFDAYRVVAPHSDRWGQYDRYEEKNVRWGAPLETIGYYMRTLNRISYPNRVAAWAQAMSNGWSSISRVDYPNPLEIRIQAYEAVANGATSLYWFTMGGDHMKNHRFSLSEIRDINREMETVGKLMAFTVPFSWENRFMDLDMNVIAGPDFAALFAIDLSYQVSDKNQFVSAGERYDTMRFQLPGYLFGSNAAVRIRHDGISQVQTEVVNGKAVITDTIKTTAMYILYDSLKINYAQILMDQYDELLEKEAGYGFNPINNDNQWDSLVKHIDIIDEVIPYPYLTLQAVPEGSGWINGGGNHLPWQMVSLVVTPRTGFEFSHWTDESGDTLYLDQGKYEMPDGDATLMAHFQSTVGIDASVADRMKLYPNPGIGLLNIEFEVEIEKDCVIDVMSICGELVDKRKLEKADGGKITLDLRHLAKGIYFLRIPEAEKRRTYKIVII